MKLFLTVLTGSLFATDACAYLDAGSGSMLIQLLLGGLAGAAALIKIYWYKIVSFFKKSNKD